MDDALTIGCMTAIRKEIYLADGRKVSAVVCRFRTANGEVIFSAYYEGKVYRIEDRENGHPVWKNQNYRVRA